MTTWNPWSPQKFAAETFLGRFGQRAMREQPPDLLQSGPSTFRAVFIGEAARLSEKSVLNHCVPSRKSQAEGLTSTGLPAPMKPTEIHTGNSNTGNSRQRVVIFLRR